MESYRSGYRVKKQREAPPESNREARERQQREEARERYREYLDTLSPRDRERLPSV